MHISSNDFKEEYKCQDIQDSDLYYNSNINKNYKNFDTLTLLGTKVTYINIIMSLLPLLCLT